AGLSGGERLRLLLCGLTLADRPPDILYLDEPTNNIDLQNLEILIAGIEGYTGTLVVVSHDAHFLEQVGIGRVIALE
ncbi:MAG TPA: ABC transporter ATP-binding protein, partial [Flavobacteriales bacterium]|nr:ABC transporter ATP-binding protein [Flavobacteriales bacterium]